MSVSIAKIKSEEKSAVVSRILLTVHKALDQQFPNIKVKDKRFTRTVFSENEATLVGRVPTESPHQQVVKPPHVQRASDASQFGENQSTKANRPQTQVKKTSNSTDWLGVVSFILFLAGVASLIFVYQYL